MSDKLRTIRLYGILGTKFGRIHQLAVSNTREAIKALSILIPGFEKFMIESKDQGLTFSLFIGGRNINPRCELHNPPGNDDIRIVPVIQGSKRAGLFQTILGVALMISAIWFGPAAFAAGLSLTLGGVAQMLAPQASGLASEDKPDNRPNYSFNGTVNTSAQGATRSVLYGEFMTGSAVASAGIYAEDQI